MVGNFWKETVLLWTKFRRILFVHINDAPDFLQIISVIRRLAYILDYLIFCLNDAVEGTNQRRW